MAKQAGDIFKGTKGGYRKLVKDPRGGHLRPKRIPPPSSFGEGVLMLLVGVVATWLTQTLVKKVFSSDSS